MYDIGIVGLGFLGGSLAKSLRKSNKINSILAYDKNINSLKQAKDEGVITDYCVNIDNKFEVCDIVFICTPVKSILAIAAELEKVTNNNCIITDTGSTKKTIIQSVKELKHEFIGGHPMVGSERSGYQTSKENLFENSYYIITKNKNNKPNSIKVLEEIIEEIRAIPIIIDECEHDFITATISHVPHIIASSLTTMVQQLDNEDEIMKTLAARRIQGHYKNCFIRSNYVGKYL